MAQHATKWLAKSLICLLSYVKCAVSTCFVQVLWVQRGGNDYYFAFGGCHRWEAHKQLKRGTIRAKLIKTTPKSLSVYLGRNPFANL